MTSDEFKRGMRRLASGVCLIATKNAGIRHGLIATAVSAITADPPSLLACISKTASAHAHIAEAGIFCVNVLSALDQDVAARFSSPVDRERRFEHGDWREIVTGAPGLVSALASFDCKVRQIVPYESHTIFLAEIVAVELWAETIRPLLYLDGRYRMLSEAQKHLDAVG